MTQGKPKDIAASVQGRLTEFVRKHKEELQAVLTRCAIERFLYRLSVSQHADDFVLKERCSFNSGWPNPTRPPGTWTCSEPETVLWND